jgi:hypothetical protein
MMARLICALIAGLTSLSVAVINANTNTGILMSGMIVSITRDLLVAIAITLDCPSPYPASSPPSGTVSRLQPATYMTIIQENENEEDRLSTIERANDYQAEQ